MGSYGDFAAFKAEVLNGFVHHNNVQSVIEFGSGDGNQLTLADYPRYLGVDVARSAVEQCRAKFHDDSSKSFVSMDDYQRQTAELSLSLDVVYHLVEDAVFQSHLQQVFSAATRFVILYCSNVAPEQLEKRNAQSAVHVRHRDVTGYVAATFPTWKLMQHLPNRYPYNWDTAEGSFSEFFIYQKTH